jgi:hypothetical protein
MRKWLQTEETVKDFFGEPQVATLPSLWALLAVPLRKAELRGDAKRSLGERTRFRARAERILSSL